MTIPAVVSIRAFAADSRKFTQIRTHSRRIRGWIRAHSRRIRGPIPQDFTRFPRIPQDSRICPNSQDMTYEDSRGYTPIRQNSHRIYADSRTDLHGFAKVRGWIYADSQGFADGYTQIRESSPMDIRGFAGDSQRIYIIPRRESANGDSYMSTQP